MAAGIWDRRLRPELVSGLTTGMVHVDDTARELFRCFKPNVQREIAMVVVSHILPDKPAFLSVLRETYDVIGIIPKPRSIHHGTYLNLKEEWPNSSWSFTRDTLVDADTVASCINPLLGNRDLLIMDVGGYFASCLNELAKRLDGNVLGVVEDTENGHRRYEAMDTLPCPVISVAQSPLKEPEDFLVGQSVLFSAEFVLRENNHLLINKRILVIGYGKIGKSIANSLATRNIAVSIYDSDAIKLAQAYSHGFNIPDREPLIADADIIFSATGNKGLSASDFPRLKNGSYVVSVTSSDDEFDLSALDPGYNKFELPTNVVRYSNESKHFFLMDDGNAINFLHNAVVGSYIYLVQAELVRAATELAENGHELPPGISTMSEDERRHVASEWLNRFRGGAIGVN